MRQVRMKPRITLGIGPLSEVMDCSKRPDERGSHEESEAETQDYFTNNFNSYFYNFVKVGVQVLRKNIYKLFPQTYLILEFSVK